MLPVSVLQSVQEPGKEKFLAVLGILLGCEASVKIHGDVKPVFTVQKRSR